MGYLKLVALAPRRSSSISPRGREDRHRSMCRRVCDGLLERTVEVEGQLVVGWGHARVSWKAQCMEIGLVARGGFATQRECRVEEGVACLSERMFVGRAMPPRSQ